VQRRLPIVLQPDLLFDKIVTRRRGGFCYELNGLFAELLQALGFDVHRMAAQVVAVDDTPRKPFGHLTLRVELDRPYLVDVGFGDAFFEPLPLVAGIHHQGNRAYALEESGGQWLYRPDPAPTEGAVGYGFALAAHPLSAFAEVCDWTQTSPDSHFVKNLICTRPTADGRVTISGDRLLTTTGANKHVSAIADPEALTALLRERFGFSESEAEG
jgi:N-hydroxyarylamine O-acetyltransferase